MARIRFKSVLGAALGVWVALTACLFTPAAWADRGWRESQHRGEQLQPPPSWQALTPEQRQGLVQEWQRATPERRQRMQQGVEHYLQMNPDQRRAVEEKRRWFDGLDPARRRAVCDRYYAEQGWRPPSCNGQ